MIAYGLHEGYNKYFRLSISYEIESQGQINTKAGCMHCNAIFSYICDVFVCLFDLILYVPVKNFSVMSRRVFLG